MSRRPRRNHQIYVRMFEPVITVRQCGGK